MNDNFWGSDPRHSRRGRGPWNPWGASGGPGPNPGPPPWLSELLGFAQPAPSAPRGPKVRRGDVRTAILDVLHRAGQADEPINGYQVIQQISDLSDGAWRPSPGSVYPTIAQLEDEGLVTSDDARGRRTIRLTPEGVAWAQSHTEDLEAVWAPFQEAGPASATDAPGSPGADFKGEIGQVLSAAWQLVTQGSESQRRAALDVLVETRRNLYQILADGRGPKSGQQ